MQNSWFKKGFKRIASPDLDLDEELSSHCILEAVDSDSESYPSKPHCLNAFDIISLSPGFDLSGLFEKDRKSSKAQAWFTTQMPTVVAKLEEVATVESFKIKKKNAIVKMKGNKGGRKGELVIDAEIFEVTPSFHMVEVKKTAGDTLEYLQFCDQELKPSLKDVVWSWQDDGQDLQKKQAIQEEYVH